MSAALRHHKLQLNSNGGSYHNSTSIVCSGSSRRRQRDGNVYNTVHNIGSGHPIDNNSIKDSDESDDNDDMTTSHCSLSATDHHTNNNNLLSMEMTSELPQYPCGTQVKKYFHGHGWCMGSVLAYNKGKYKIRFERPATTGITSTTHVESYFEANEMPRLIKTASVFPGTKLEIYWPQERRYYTAMIKTEQPRKRENYLVCYDDSEHAKRISTVDRREWIDLHRHRFRIVVLPESEHDGITSSNTSNNTPYQDDGTSDICLQTSVFNDHHPREVLIVQQSNVSSTDEIDDSAITTNSPSHCKSEGAAYSSNNSKHVHNVSADDASTTKFMHVVSNVPSQSKPLELMKTDESLDVSQNGSATTEPPQTVVSMETDNLIVNKLESNSDYTTSLSHRGISPGSMASSNRSILQSIECDLNSPNLQKSTSVKLHNNSTTDAASALVRRISQDTCPIRDTDSNSNDNQCSSGNDMDVCVSQGNNNMSSLSTSLGNISNVNDVAINATTGNVVEEEGIVIDPDNDEATKTAILSLIDVGSRVAVYWENDDDFFPGTITDRSFRGKPFLLQYDDDDYEWIDLRKHRFKLLPSSTTKLTEQNIVSEATKSRSTRRSSNLSLNGSVSLNHKMRKRTIAVDKAKAALASKQPSSSSSSSIADASIEMVQVPKRSIRNATKPSRFKEIFDSSSESGDGLPKISARAKRRTISNFRDQKSDEEDDADIKIASIQIGTHVAVWWSGDRQYYNAVVTKERKHKKKPFFIEYDGTDEVEWIDFTRHKFKILSPPTTIENEKVPDNIHIKSDQNNGCGASYQSSDSSKKRYRLGSPVGKSSSDYKSENGNIPTDKKRKHEAVSNDLDDDVAASMNGDVCDFITVGCRVSVFWEGDGKYYDGIVTRERKTSGRKHYLEYDDGEAAHWIDFREHWVRLLPPNDEDSASRNDTNSGSKKKHKSDTTVGIQPRRKGSPLKKTASKQIVSEDKKKIKDAVSSKQNDKSLTAKTSTVDTEDLSDLPIGTRVEIWWDGDQTYYKGTIMKQGPNKNKKYLIKYDDNEVHWVYFARNRVRVLKTKTANKMKRETNTNVTTKSDDNDISTTGDKRKSKVATSSTKKVEKVPPVKAFDSKNTKKSDSKITKKAKLVKYAQKKHDKQSLKAVSTKKSGKQMTKKVDLEDSDESDGDEIDSDASSTSDDHMAYKDFVYGNVDKLKVGSRISVWWCNYRRYYHGTIKKIKSDTGCRRPYFIKYDDNDTEWTDLRRRYFRILD